MEWLVDPQAWIALATLTVLEIVLGIDNIVFISILTGRLPEHERQKGRLIGLAFAMVGRLVLLLSIAWIMGLTRPIFEVDIFHHHLAFSWRDLILIAGGFFLIWKSTTEIHHKIEGDDDDPEAGGKALTFKSAMVQILVLDLVFSLDSVITAVGMAEHIPVMIAAVVIAVIVMMLTAKSVAEFIHRYPTVKMLALAFLLLVGVALIVDGFHGHLPRGYIYSAMIFSVFVEFLNLRAQKKREETVAAAAPPSGGDDS